MIELQYRTGFQHAWATASELVTQMTGSEPKFGRGDPRHIEYFRLASEIIARAFETRTSCYPKFSDSELVEKFKDVEVETNLTTLSNFPAFFRWPRQGCKKHYSSVIRRFRPYNS